MHTCVRACTRRTTGGKTSSSHSFLLGYGVGKKGVCLSGQLLVLSVAQQNPGIWEGRQAYKPGFVLSYEDPRSHGGAQSQVQEGLSRGWGLPPCLGHYGAEGISPQSHTAAGTVAGWALSTPCPVVRVHLRARAGAFSLVEHHAGLVLSLSGCLSCPAHASWQRHLLTSHGRDVAVGRRQAGLGSAGPLSLGEAWDSPLL